jgi:hypothetical protein
MLLLKTLAFVQPLPDEKTFQKKESRQALEGRT